MQIAYILALALGCVEKSPGELVFLRDGLIAPGGDEGRALADGRRFLERDWRPGEVVRAAGLEAIAPVQPECRALFSVPLGEVDRLIAAGGSPDTALAWAPDGRLAIGSHKGELLVVDGWTGAVLARRGLAETMVKALAWSADGATLYAAEQSPDALVYALDPETLATEWSVRLADFVDSSVAPAGEDLYGVYSLPGAYGLAVLADGSILVAALHSWSDGGLRKNRSQLLRISAAGSVIGRWPETAADATFLHPRVSGDRAVMSVGRSADGPPPAGLPIGGVVVIALDTMTPVMSASTPPLEPWFKEATVWGALDVSDDAVLAGYADGRVRVYGLDGALRWEGGSGQPILAGDVPIFASIGWGFLHDGGVVYATGNTHIPWGAAAPDLRPPTAHPEENSLWSIDGVGRPRWSWTGEQRIEGLSLGEDGRHLAVGAGERIAEERRDLYGGLIFDLQSDEPGQPEVWCPTEGPVFFRQALAADGRLALAEHPTLGSDGASRGAYRVTVVR